MHQGFTAGCLSMKSQVSRMTNASDGGWSDRATTFEQNGLISWAPVTAESPCSNDTVTQCHPRGPHDVTWLEGARLEVVALYRQLIEALCTEGSEPLEPVLDARMPSSMPNWVGHRKTNTDPVTFAIRWLT